MQPIHELLARIRWDEDYAKCRCIVGYWDRIAGKTLHVNLGEITWDADNPAMFNLVDEDGITHGIPFHRVREVWRDGSLIWSRNPGDGQDGSQ